MPQENDLKSNILVHKGWLDVYFVGYKYDLSSLQVSLRVVDKFKYLDKYPTLYNDDDSYVNNAIIELTQICIDGVDYTGCAEYGSYQNDGLCQEIITYEPHTFTIRPNLIHPESSTMAFAINHAEKVKIGFGFDIIRDSQCMHTENFEITLPIKEILN